MLKMMSCPACGMANSEKRDTCYSCQALLRAAAPGSDPLSFAPPDIAGQRVCANCCRSTVYPPRGTKLRQDEVWCNVSNKPIAVINPGAECFVSAFGWQSNKILD
jgi:hypothetical protein